MDIIEENIYSTTSLLGEITTGTMADRAASASKRRREGTVFGEAD